MRHESGLLLDELARVDSELAGPLDPATDILQGEQADEHPVPDDVPLLRCYPFVVPPDRRERKR